MSDLSVRPFDPTQDYPAVAALASLSSNEPITPEELADGDQRFPVEGVRERHLAIGPDGRPVGMAVISRWPFDAPGTVFVRVAVMPDARRQGLGSRLADLAFERAAALGGKLLRAELRDNAPEALAFAQQRGFAIDRHLFESTLDLATFDDTRFACTVEAVQAGGIRFFAEADESSEVLRRRIHALVSRTVQDIPGWREGDHMPPFEDWVRMSLEDPHAYPDCHILAADGERIVGVTAMEHRPETGAMYTVHTSVDPAYRGRKIALALKLLSVQAARRHGAPYMRTNNDSQNAPMLAVNRKMGYVPSPGIYTLMKQV